VQIIPAETFEKIDEKNAERQAAGRPLLPYPSRDLASCPYNRFAGDFPTGTTPLGSTSGKDNNEYRELFIVLAGAESVVPYQLSIPATSLKAWDGRGGYANGLITKGIRLSTVETVITAASTKVGANEFTTFTFSRGGKLAPDVKDKARAYAVGVQDFVKRDPFAVARAATNELAAPEQPALEAAPVQEPVQEAVQEAVHVAAEEPVVETEPAPVEAPAVQEPVAVGSADDIEF
jgi:hypothetical protein